MCRLCQPTTSGLRIYVWRAFGISNLLDNIINNRSEKMTNVPVPRNRSGSAAVKPACSVSKDNFVFSTSVEWSHSKNELQFSYRKKYCVMNTHVLHFQWCFLTNQNCVIVTDTSSIWTFYMYQQNHLQSVHRTTVFVNCMQ